MAKFYENEKGIGYFYITDTELMDYSDIENPVCDNCLESVVGNKNLMLIPIYNEVFCEKCAANRLARVIDYPEDRPIRHRYEKFYKNHFKITE